MQNLEGLEYLDRYGVTAYMKDVVTLLLENRPSQPIAFISKYFRTVTQGSSPLLRAYRYIRLAGPTQAAFIDNVVSAYVALDTRRGTSGVTGAELLRLLRLLCADCPVDVSRPLLLLLNRTESDPIGFEEFSAAVRAAVYYEEFFQRVSMLFATCDPHGMGRVPVELLQIAVGQVGGKSDDWPRASSSAAHVPLESLHHEVQREVAKFQGISASCCSSNGQGGISGSRGGSSSSSSVALEEFLLALFSASVTGLPTAAAAIDITKHKEDGSGAVGVGGAKF